MNTKFAVCIKNKGFEASLEIGKLYEIVGEETDEMLRIVDEEGEDYLYESQNFYPLVLPADLVATLHERTSAI